MESFKKYVLRLFLLLLFAIIGCNSEKQAFEHIEIAVRDLIPEGIAYDEKNDAFFLSSLHKHKIVQYSMKSEEAVDFIPSGYEDFGIGVGMKINKENRELIALSSKNESGLFTSHIHFLDLDSGSLNKKVVLQDSISFFFNDLDIGVNGNIYISDSDGSRIFSLSFEDSNLSEFYHEENMYPNGVALDDNDNNLFIASWQKGILRLDIDSLKTLSIHPEGSVISSQGIDGLYFYRNSLIAIQNGYQDKAKHKILRFYLDDNNIVDKIDTLAIDHSSFDIPTTGVIVKDRFYVLANSQLENLNQETNEIIDTSILEKTYILRISLKE